MKWNFNKLPDGKHDGSVWYSDDVIVIDEDGCPHRVFYDHQYKNWNDHYTQCKIREKIICWIKLPIAME